MERFIGLYFDSAKEKFKEENIKWRLTRVDSKQCIITCDYNPERLNIELKNNIIINITLG